MAGAEMMMRNAPLTCLSCGARCTVDVLSSGVGESEYLYCDRCSGAALLDFYASESSTLVHLGKDRWWQWRASAADMASIEAELRTCECGGHFPLFGRSALPEARCWSRPGRRETPVGRERMVARGYVAPVGRWSLPDHRRSSNPEPFPPTANSGLVTLPQRKW